MSTATAPGCPSPSRPARRCPAAGCTLDGDRRQVFLGTVRTTPAQVAPPYGTNPARDVAGVVERVGPLRWRLVMTRAGQGAILDLYELVPAPPATPR
ncbi:DUF4893 domain-containing protein [Sphingomonas aerolata]